MRLTFRPDGTLTVEGQLAGEEALKESTWMTASVEVAVLTLLTTTESESGLAESENMTVEFVTVNAMEIAHPGGQSMPFERVEP
ncbi:MAG: hypothetical protein ACJAYU_001405 [Bradymonadia bacterium]|jgi:hypothetical protein